MKKKSQISLLRDTAGCWQRMGKINCATTNIAAVASNRLMQGRKCGGCQRIRCASACLICSLEYARKGRSACYSQQGIFQTRSGNECQAPIAAKAPRSYADCAPQIELFDARMLRAGVTFRHCSIKYC